MRVSPGGGLDGRAPDGRGEDSVPRIPRVRHVLKIEGNGKGSELRNTSWVFGPCAPL